MSTITKTAQRPEAPVVPGTRVVRVALAGCGTVSGELVGLLERRAGTIARTRGLRFELTRILVRDPAKPRPAAVPLGLLTTDVDEFLAADADVVVEAIGGLEPAGRIAAAALLQGRTLVTANKALVAARGPELASLARQHGGRLLYEAAVAGGVPVIATLRDALAETGVRSIRGILNGTSNYLLTRMAEGADFDTALQEARARGYAEADATRDLDGRDAADKIAILAWLAFGADPSTLSVHRRGLLPRPDRLAADAAAYGAVPRLLGECGIGDDGVFAVVEPVITSRSSATGRTTGVTNILEIRTDHNGTIRLSGPGAGGAPTASAVLSDLIHGSATLAAGGASAARAAVVPVAGHPLPEIAAADGRAHAWVISARVGAVAGDLAAFIQSLRGAGIEPVHVQEDPEAGLVRARTAPCVRARILEVEQALERRGLEPALSRYEGG